MPSNPNEPPLDEIQWRSPAAIAHLGALHSNTILFYFAESPFFERTSNNAVIMSQAMSNPAMYHYIQTREAFEGRLRTMSGLEFIVGEEPAETGPGMGTGVWVVRKQTRRKRYQEEDDVAIHASYFIVGENIYMAPTLGDILSSRIMSISNAISQALPQAEDIRKWRPSHGHVYHLPGTTQRSSSSRPQESKEGTPVPDKTSSSSSAHPLSDESSLERAVEESFMTHMRYGGEYADENPITGRPGEFHLSSTGRKPVPPPHVSEQQAAAGIGAMNGPAKPADDKKDGKDKTQKSGSVPKLKRRKSKLKGSTTTTPSAS